MAIVICGPNCTAEQKNSGGRCGDPQRSYEGMVLDMYEVNGSWDSDFYAIVWDGANGTKTIEYASTRGWTYHNGASVDADASVQRMAREFHRDRVRTVSLARAQEMAREVSKGSKVRITKGKQKGLTGIVTWVGIDKYKSSRMFQVPRYGITVDGVERDTQFNTKVFASADQVERVEPDVVDVDWVIRTADHYVDTTNFRSLVRYTG